MLRLDDLQSRRMAELGWVVSDFGDYVRVLGPNQEGIQPTRILRPITKDEPLATHQRARDGAEANRDRHPVLWQLQEVEMGEGWYGAGVKSLSQGQDPVVLARRWALRFNQD